MRDTSRPLELGMQTYSLHFFGLCASWGVEDGYEIPQIMDIFALMDFAYELQIDGLQISKVDLGEIEPGHLARVRRYADERGLFLEFCAAVDYRTDPRLNCSIEEAVEISDAIGARLCKYSLDIVRPRILYGSCMASEIVQQLELRCEELSRHTRLLDAYDLCIALENHGDTFSDEIDWCVRQLSHPRIGSCVDTVNSLMVMESPEHALDTLLPSALCCHLSDDLIYVDELGVHDTGVACGQGSIDIPRVVERLRVETDLDRVIFENEISFAYKGESLESARRREMQACRQSVRYLKEELGLGTR